MLKYAPRRLPLLHDQIYCLSARKNPEIGKNVANAEFLELCCSSKTHDIFTRQGRKRNNCSPLVIPDDHWEIREPANTDVST